MNIDISSFLKQTKYTLTINKVKSISSDILNKFVSYLNLEPEEYIDLCDVNISVGNVGIGEAEYLADSNTVIVDSRCLDSKIVEIDKINRIIGSLEKLNISSDFTLEEYQDQLHKIYEDLAFTIIHELFHAKTGPSIVDGITVDNVHKLRKLELDSYKNGHSLEEYSLLLSDILYKPYASKFKPYIPVKAISNINNTLSVVAYNTDTKCYEFFDSQEFTTKITSNADEWLISLAEELNSGESTRVPSEIIPSLINRGVYDEDEIKTTSGYYHGYAGYLLTKKDIVNAESKKDIETALLNSSDSIIDKINWQESFDEVMTEVITIICAKHYKDSNLDLEKISNKVQTSSIYGDDIKGCFKLVAALGPDILRSFMSSSKGKGSYLDYLYDILQDKYDRVMYIFSVLYFSAVTNENFYDQLLEELAQIINEKINKKRSF